MAGVRAEMKWMVMDADPTSSYQYQRVQYRAGLRPVLLLQVVSASDRALILEYMHALGYQKA